MSKPRCSLVIRTVFVILVMAVFAVAAFFVVSGSPKPKPAAIWITIDSLNLTDKLTLLEIAQPATGVQKIFGANEKGTKTWYIDKCVSHSQGRSQASKGFRGSYADYYIQRDAYLCNGVVTVTYPVLEKKIGSAVLEIGSKTNHGFLDLRTNQIEKSRTQFCVYCRDGYAFDNPNHLYQMQYPRTGFLLTECDYTRAELKINPCMLQQGEYMIQMPEIYAESIRSIDDTLFIIGKTNEANLSYLFTYRVSFYDLKNDRVTACFDFADFQTCQETIGINDLLREASTKPSRISDIKIKADKIASEKIGAIKLGILKDTNPFYSYRIYPKQGIKQLAPSFGELPALFSLHATKHKVGSSKTDERLFFLFSLDEKSLKIDDIETPVGQPYGDTTEMLIDDSAFDYKNQRLFMSFSVFDKQKGSIGDARNKGKCQSAIWILDDKGKWSKLGGGATYSELSIAPDGALWFIESSGYVPNAGNKKNAVIRVSPDLSEKKEVFTSSKIIHTLLVDPSE